MPTAGDFYNRPEYGGDVFTPADPKELEDYKPNRLNAVGQAVSENNFITGSLQWLARQAESLEFKADENFNPRSRVDDFKQIDSDYWDELREAKSDEHFDHLLTVYGKRTADKQYLESLGLEGLAYSTVAMIADLPMAKLFTAGKFAGKVGALYDKMNSTRWGKAVLVGAGEGVLEASKQALRPEDEDEMALMLAMGLGAAAGSFIKPDVFTPEVQEIMTRHARESMETLANSKGGERVFSDKVKDFVENRQVNITSAFKKSESPLMRKFGDIFFVDHLKDGQAIKLDEIAGAVEDKIRGTFNIESRELFQDFAKEVGGHKSSLVNSTLRIDLQERFYHTLGGLHYGDPRKLSEGLSDGLIERMHAFNAKMSKESHEILTRAGHQRFVDGSIEAVDDYLPVRWNKELIRNQAANVRGFKETFQQAVAQGFRQRLAQLKETGSVVVRSEEEIVAASKRFVDKLLQPAKTGGQFFQEAMEQSKVFDELAESFNLTEEELDMLRRAVAPKSRPKGQKGNASAVRGRTPLDLSATAVSPDGTRITLSEMLDHNVQSLWGRYAKTMGGDTALRRAGIETRNDLMSFRGKVEKELSHLTDSERTRELAVLDGALGHLLGLPAHRAPDSALWSMARTANNLTRSARLGATWWSMTAELASVMHRDGMQAVVNSSKALKEIVQVYRGGKPSDLLKEISLGEGLFTDILSTSSGSKIDDALFTGYSGNGFLKNAEKFSERANSLTMMLGGVQSGTAILELSHILSARKMLVTAAKEGVDETTYRYFKHLDFAAEDVDKLVRELSSKSDLSDFYRLNTDQWDDSLKELWDVGIRRSAGRIVQRAAYGDQLAITTGDELLKDSIFGSLLMTLKSYTLTAYNKQLSRGIYRMANGNAKDVIENWAFQWAMTSFAYMAKTASDTSLSSEQLKERLSPDRILASSLSMTTFSSVVPSTVDNALELTGFDRFFNNYSRGEADWIASVGWGYDVKNGISTLSRTFHPNENVTPAQFRKAISPVPLGNWFLIKQMTNGMSKAYED